MDRRRACALVWSLLVVLGLVSWFGAAPMAILVIWLVALPTIFFTSRATRDAHDERLDLSVAYRTAAAAAFAVPVGGALLAAVPGHSGLSTIFVPYFGLVAFLAYRALVARGPRRALAALTAAQLVSVPFLFLGALGSLGCKCGHWREPPWTDRWTFVLCFATQLFAMIAAGVALIAFSPRDEFLPEARLA